MPFIILLRDKSCILSDFQHRRKDSQFSHSYFNNLQQRDKENLFSRYNRCRLFSIRNYEAVYTWRCKALLNRAKLIGGGCNQFLIQTIKRSQLRIDSRTSYVTILYSTYGVSSCPPEWFCTHVERVSLPDPVDRSCREWNWRREWHLSPWQTKG